VASASHDNRNIAVAFRQGDSTVLAIVAVGSGEHVRAHSVVGTAAFTFAWSEDGRRLGAGYRATGAPPSAGPSSGVMVVGLDGSARDVGCSVSNRVLAWVTNGNLAVGDGRNVYIVSPRDCNTLATIPLRDNKDVTFSPDGRKVTLRKSPRDQFSRQRAGNRLELYVADFNGANARRVTDYRYDAQKVRWAPDSRKIAFELQSQQFANVTHVAVYDVARDQATFDARARTLGQPDDGNPQWAPGGTMLVHDRVYARRSAGQSYSTNQKVVKTLPQAGGTLSDAAEKVVAEELAQTGEAVTGEPVGTTWGWADDRHLVFSSAQRTRIVNIETAANYDLPGGVALLSVVVLGLAP
jgi:dipeptidyl aminopeptidase/acylaminoacyl peptidase